MSLTPLLDELNQLGDAGADLLVACQAVVDQARAEQLERDRTERRQLLDQRVAAFFLQNIQASANDAYWAIGGSRAEVLAAVRRARTDTTAQYQQGDAA